MSDSKLNPLNWVQRLCHVGLITTWVSSCFVLIALATYYPTDPGWSQVAWGTQTLNAMGLAGAWVADVLLFTFGLTAYMIPFVVAAIGWLTFHQVRYLDSLDYFSISLRIIGFLMVACSVAALAALNADDIHYFSAGGLIGDIIAEAMLPIFNFIGTTLILISFIASGFTLVTGISWVTVAEVIGALCIGAALWLYRLPSHFSNEQEDSEDTQEFLDVVEEFQAPKPIAKPAGTAAKPGQSAPPSPLVKADNLDELDGLAQHSSIQSDAPAEAFIPPWATNDAAESTAIEPSFSAIEPEPELEPTTAVPPAIDPIDAAIADEAVAATAPAAPAIESYLADAIAKQHPQGQSAPLSVPTAPMPTLELLDRPNKSLNPISREELDGIARLVEAKLLDFNIQAHVVDVHPGPVITRFELDLAPGIKVSKISNLAKDLARALSAVSVRVVEVIPGKSVIGLELPNKHREIVYLRDVIGSPRFEDAASNLTMVLGQDISGQAVVVDLAKMPHLLVAGTTGSGKSVGVNVMILSLLYKSTPEDVRLIMIDPKMLELSVYEGIPHLLCEVVTDMKEASNALRWCVGEMERRYKLMSALGVRNLNGYNAKVLAAAAAGEPIKDPFWTPEQSMETEAPNLEKLPAIVVVVDEFADMMMIVGKKVEELIARIAQKARAAGIHLILATQRPSVDVITGLIKANIPTRIAFQVSSRIDSRTILDQQGAEQLLGQGDMLYLPPGTSVPTRVHGAFVDDHEVHAVVADWSARAKPVYVDEILNGENGGESVLLPGESAETDSEQDPLYDEAVAFVIESRRASISSVQRKLKVGYNRAARLVEQMETSGIVSKPAHNGNREVLVPGRSND
ncbi:DNA translocase FtsK [uncultured Ferrimonas sp.]|uniref:DNA translocase FtsK n=1 Tax=uncultured Ferrimonas sp. TaxID=432640 RepID=UPI0026074220|nr:DNA translocase FtsK [uncultured Ferrimonas sp.]